MSNLSPGQEVTVSPSGITAEVLYVRGDSVRVRNVNSGKERTVAIKNVTPKRESKVLSVGAEELAAARQLGMRHPSIPNPLTRPIERAVLPVLRPVPKPVTLASPAYLAYVRKHPCCLCGTPGPSEAHHWSHHGGVMGAKVDDYRTVPLCQEHHRHWHDHGEFPRHDRDESEAIMLAAQRELLAAWCENAIDRADMVDALIRAIGGADA